MNAPIDISTVTLKTERLILRPWRETDLQDLYDYASVDGVGQMAGWTPHKNQEESRQILEHFIEGKHVFALEYQGKVIGSLGIEEYNEEHYDGDRYESNADIQKRRGRKAAFIERIPDKGGLTNVDEYFRQVFGCMFGYKISLF